MLETGLYTVPVGMIATVVTSLEMLRAPIPRPDAPAPGWQFQQIHPDPAEHCTLYRAVGEDWLWASRLSLSETELQAIASSPDVEIFKLSAGPDAVGMLELDFREAGRCELKFFGLSRPLQGGKAGRWLMNRALERAWSKPITRFWVHTCTLDHQSAVRFYVRSGFQPFRQEVQVFEDPRLHGLVCRDAGARVPLIFRTANRIHLANVGAHLETEAAG